jgi:uncharacterized protein YegL
MINNNTDRTNGYTPTEYESTTDGEMLVAGLPLLYGIICDASLSMTVPLKNGSVPLDIVNRVVSNLSIAFANQDEADILPALVRFGGTVDLVSKFSTIEEFQPSTIRAKTGSPLGAAVNAMLDEIESARLFLTQNGVNKILRPVILLYTDGSPTDDWKAAAQRACDLVTTGKLTIIIGAVGSEKFLNKEILSNFTVNPELIFCVEPDQIDVFIRVTSTLVVSGSKGKVEEIKTVLTDSLANGVVNNNDMNDEVVIKEKLQQKEKKQLKPIAKRQLPENNEVVKPYNAGQDIWDE